MTLLPQSLEIYINLTESLYLLMYIVSCMCKSGLKELHLMNCAKNQSKVKGPWGVAHFLDAA